MSRANVMRAGAFAIVLAGIVVAGRVYEAANRAEAVVTDPDADAAAGLAPGDSKRYGYQVGQVSGPVGVLVDRVVRMGEAATHGRPLAALIALGAFWGGAWLLVAADRAGK